MSVLLTSDIYINAVLTASGTTVSLGYGLEQDLVYQGNATWVSIPTVVPSLVNNSLIERTPGALPEYVGPIASRSALPDSYTGSNTTKYMKSKTRHVFYDGGSEIQLVFSTVYGSGGEGALGAGTYSCAAFVTIRGVSYQITFGGEIRGTSNYGTHLYSDMLQLPITFNSGEAFTVTNYTIFNPTGSFYPFFKDGLNYQFGLVADVCTISSTALPELVLGEAITSNSAYQNTIYRPTAILGYTTKYTAVIMGDSRNRGSGGTNNNALTDINGINGECARILDRLGIGYINCASSGDSYYNATQANAYIKRAELAQFCAFAIDAYGINDIGNGTNVAYTCTSTSTKTVVGISTANMTAGLVGSPVTGTNIPSGTVIATYVSASSVTLSKTPYGPITAFTLVGPAVPVSMISSYITTLRTLIGFLSKPYLKSTLTPRAASAPFANSTDIVTFSTSQNPAPSEAVRVLVNEAARNGLLPIDDYIDPCVAIESSKNSGKHVVAANARVITDGVMNSGSNLLTSATAAFTSVDSGGFVYVVGAGTAGANIGGMMDYINATTVALVTNISTTASVQVTYITASTSVTGATAYLNHRSYTTDGLHLSGWGEEVVAKNSDIRALNKFK